MSEKKSGISIANIIAIIGLELAPTAASMAGLIVFLIFRMVSLLYFFASSLYHSWISVVVISSRRFFPSFGIMCFSMTPFLFLTVMEACLLLKVFMYRLR